MRRIAVVLTGTIIALALVTTASADYAVLFGGTASVRIVPLPNNEYRIVGTYTDSVTGVPGSFTGTYTDFGGDYSTCLRPGGAGLCNCNIVSGTMTLRAPGSSVTLPIRSVTPQESQVFYYPTSVCRIVGEPDTLEVNLYGFFRTATDWEWFTLFGRVVAGGGVTYVGHGLELGVFEGCPFGFYPQLCT
jgi:hypothetical protein